MMTPRRTLLRGGHILSMDPEVGELPAGDILIEDDTIAAVGVDLGVADTAAEIVDVDGAIVIPGLVDTHRHTWQTPLRGVCADFTLLDYFRVIRVAYSQVYRPEDVRTGNYVGALEALDAGVTTILDYSHCMNSPDHADASVAGLQEARIRALHCYGFYHVPLQKPVFVKHEQRLADACRIREKYFTSDDQLLTMGLAGSEVHRIPFSATETEVRLANELGVPITFHSACYWGMKLTHCVSELHSVGLLGQGQIHSHANACTDAELALLARHGSFVSCTPETEMGMSMGSPIIGRALDAGLRPTLGCDIVSLNSGDLFTQMRLAISSQRALAHDVETTKTMGVTNAVRAEDVLRFATQDGATSLGLGSRIGSLTPGKQADVVVLRSSGLSLTPVNAPVAGAVVFQAGARDVEHVLVAGSFVKRDGSLLADIASARRDIQATRDHLADHAADAVREALADSEEYRSRLEELSAANAQS
ncbi:amidohydrolase family protein [Pseudonocardia sp. NPDC049635]|uniref:amidohydrolase family protein n=1 Tax=Pseudonocardia sp. NPDC049635 TaxID=3155506 RepID=UPI0033CB0991